MPKFVRFIVILLIAGSAVSLGMVIVSNAKSRREQDLRVAKERAWVETVMGNMSGRLCRAQIVINGQNVDADRNILETTLLVRQFTYKQEPLPVREVVVPGGKVCVDGVHLIFGAEYPEEYKEMRGKNLWLLMHVYAPEQKEEDRFSFWTGWTDESFEVPMAMRVHPLGLDAHVSYFENKLWQRVWDLMRMPAEAQQRSDFTVMTPEKLPSLKACEEMYLQDSRHSGLYEVSVGLEGLTISEIANVRERTAIRDAWKEMKAGKKKK